MGKSFEQDLIKSAEDHQSELNQLLQDLIRIRSYSGEEEEIVSFIIVRFLKSLTAIG